MNTSILLAVYDSEADARGIPAYKVHIGPDDIATAEEILSGWKVPASCVEVILIEYDPENDETIHDNQGNLEEYAECCGLDASKWGRK